MTKSSINLDSLSIEELTQLIQEAEAKRSEKQESARAALIEDMRTRAAQLGLGLEDLIGRQAAPQTNVRKVRTDVGKPVPVKFRGPDDATWSGRGRMPKWLSDAIARGKSKDEFAV